MVHSVRTLAAALGLASTTACGSYHFEAYREAISANQQAIQSLRLGMTDAEVRSAMGEGEVVRYKKIYLVDPWRSESFLLPDGTSVRIHYYVTQPPGKYHRPADEALTPIALEDDRVVGWGWSYLRRQSDRYRVSTPREQR